MEEGPVWQNCIEAWKVDEEIKIILNEVEGIKDYAYYKEVRKDLKEKGVYRGVRVEKLSLCVTGWDKSFDHDMTMEVRKT